MEIKIDEIESILKLFDELLIRFECDDYAVITNIDEYRKLKNAYKIISEFLPEKRRKNIFKVGDIVCFKDSEPSKDDCDYGIITYIHPEDRYMNVMRKDGSCSKENISDFYWLCSNYPEMEKILKKLKGVSENENNNL